MAAQRANREARMEAQARGAPEHAVALLLDTAEPPEVPGWGRPCRMTLAVRQIMLRWATLPADCRMEDLTCLMYVFLRPRAAWKYLSGWNAQLQRWTDETCRTLWQDSLMELGLALTEQPPELTEQMAAWVQKQIADFFGQPPAVTTTTPPPEANPEPVAAEPKAAAPDGGCVPPMTSPPTTPAATSSAPSGTSP